MGCLSKPIGVYAILDAGIAAPAELPNAAADLAATGVRVFQVRAKTLGAGAFVELVRKVRFSLPLEALLIVNDRVDVALAAGADGVHLGDEDISVCEARRLLPAGAVIGFSTHSVSEVSQAQSMACDYLGFGPVFASATKVTRRVPHGLAGLAKACRESRVPVVAIGGIGIDAVAGVREAGASGVAMISALLVPGEVRDRGAAAVQAFAGQG